MQAPSPYISELRRALPRVYTLIAISLLILALFGSQSLVKAQAGCQVIYAGSGEGTGPASDLFIASTDGKIVRRLTNEASIYQEPIWSPDGTKVAYASSFEADSGIFIRDSASGQLELASPPIVGIQKMYWSLSRKHISYETIDGQIGIYDVQANTVDPMFDTGQNTLYGWSPDGKKVLYTHGSQTGQGLRLYDVDTGNTDFLTDVYDTDAAWSPDGQFIAFMRNDGPLGIFYLEVSSGFTGSLLPNVTARNLNWSSDEHSIAFAGDTGIQVVDFKTAKITQISSVPSDDFPVWSSDGSKILYSTNMEAQFSTLAIVNADRTSLVQVGEGQQRVDTTAHLGMWYCVSAPTPLC